MIIDVHGHVTAPDTLYVHKSNILSHRVAHGAVRPAPPTTTSARRSARPVFGGSSHLARLKEVGTGSRSSRPAPIG